MSLLHDSLLLWIQNKDNPPKHTEISTQLLRAIEHELMHPSESENSEDLLAFLSLTSQSSFLLALPTDTDRTRWFEAVTLVLQHTNYSLRDLLWQRVEEHPSKTMFRDMSVTTPVDWSYDQIFRHLKEIATVFRTLPSSTPTRVAIFTDNCLEGACCDLACLCWEIFVTPLSIHFSKEVLTHIFNALGITIAVADSKERLMLLQQIKPLCNQPFQIFSIYSGQYMPEEIPYLPEECKKLTRNQIESALESVGHQRTNRVATTMFTSGSTGLPKGVSFSIYNLVSKRFARAAALPFVGEETFLCYLPLFHTFGRYLEMMGTIFWRGTYIFAGNTSAETLLSLFPKVNPTGFISIPLRWQELYDRCQERIGENYSPAIQDQAVKEVVGARLKWGLSAAGYLDPKVFRFFNQHGIYLCSGFGMTEGTGGITMTPPGEYRDFTVGKPLPGVVTRLAENSELEISGHYIAKYLEEAPPDGEIPYPSTPDLNFWLSTGDVFSVSPEGYFSIVDRVKDIYKNNRGQTVAPQVMEKKFNQVPGFKSTFLVGDHRPYNVLLIVPNTEDPISQSLSGENMEEYFHQIVMAANADAAPYERVVNFTILDRPFSAELGEITPKGSFNRKIIEKNFETTIESLYTSEVIKIPVNELIIQIPRWFYRDLGILENDILFQEDRLVNKRNHTRLTIHVSKQNRIRIGDLWYTIHSDVIDLGVLARQPKLWLGNPELIQFSPIKEGWDTPLKAFAPLSYFQENITYSPSALPPLKTKETQLNLANELICTAYFGSLEESLDAIQTAGQLINKVDQRLALTLRYRLEALAYHPEEDVRLLAYRILILKAPDPDQIAALPSFLDSGLSFLNEKSIQEIAASNFGKHRLDALKQRLHYYRTHLTWPASTKNQEQFETVLRMLYNFGINHFEFYVSVRAELSRWILHRSDPYLSEQAEAYFYQLAAHFEQSAEDRISRYPLDIWYTKLAFEHGISSREKSHLAGIFHKTTFLQESILLAFNELNFDLPEIPDKGIWILRLQAHKDFKHYRLSINTKNGKHYDLHLVVSDNPEFKPDPNTFYWLASLAGYPFGPAIAPLLGSSRPDLGILSTQYIGGLTAWDKIREYSEIHRSAGYLKPNAWQKTFITAISVVFKGWLHSGFQILPGVISPANIVVPELDFKESARILSLTGWSNYKNALSLMVPLVEDFYDKTAAVYPWCRSSLEIEWIFEGCVEALGKEVAQSYLTALKNELEHSPVISFKEWNFCEKLTHFLEHHLEEFHVPLSILNAIDQYADWLRMNPLTTPFAKEQTLFELMELYKINKQNELLRYYFYRHTLFSTVDSDTGSAFDALLTKMQTQPHQLPIQMVELSVLQDYISEPDLKAIFTRMIFPRLLKNPHVEFRTIDDSHGEHVVVQFNLIDLKGARYIQREPLQPREVGQLYQLFFKENYPKEISDLDNHFVVVDENERIIGGITWRILENEIALIDGIVVTSFLQGRGIASAMMDNFFATLAVRGIQVVKAHFLFGNYYMKHYFKVDKKWGALVKTLNESGN